MKNAFVLSLEYILILLIVFSTLYVSYTTYNNIQAILNKKVNQKVSLGSFEDLCKSSLNLALLSENSTIRKDIEIRDGVLKCVNKKIIYFSNELCNRKIVVSKDNFKIGNRIYFFNVISQDAVTINGSTFRSTGFSKISDDDMIYIFNLSPENNTISYIPFVKDGILFTGCFFGEVIYICPIDLEDCQVYCKGSCKVLLKKSTEGLKAFS